MELLIMHANTSLPTAHTTYIAAKKMMFDVFLFGIIARCSRTKKYVNVIRELPRRNTDDSCPRKKLRPLNASKHNKIPTAPVL